MNKNILWLWPLNFRNVRKILDVLIVKAEWKGLLVKQEIEFYIKKSIECIRNSLATLNVSAFY